MDGWITIGTKLDSTKFDQEVSNLENKIDSAEKKQELINQKTQQYKNDLAQVSSEVDRLSQEYEQAAQEAERLRQIVKTQGTDSYQGFQANLEYQKQVELVDKLSAELTKVEVKQQNVTNKVAQSNLQYENSVKQVNALRGKLQQLNVKQAQSQFDGVNKAINNMQKGLTSSVSKIGRMALGVFSVYSAYRLLSSASSTLAQYDEQYASNLDYIRFALAQGIAPVLKQLVNLAGQLLSYLNYILNAWFGINLFSNASVDSFKKMSSSASSTAKSAKEIKNQLAGFDEMNVLSSTDTSTGGASGSGGIATPSFDLSSMQGEVPSWIKWIADNKDLVISALAGIAGGILAIKLGISGIMALGIGLVIAGIVETIQAIIKFIKDPSWENFANILTGLSLILAGVAVAMLAVNAANPVAWIVLAIAAVTALAALIIKNWDKIKEVFSKAGQWFYDKVITPIGNFFSSAWEAIKNGASNAWNGIKSAFSAVGSFFQGIFNTIKSIFTTIGTTVGNVVSSAFKAVVNAILRTIENVLNTPIRAVNSLIGVINKVPRNKYK